MNTDDISINKEDVKRARYNLAPASHRIFARILDFILMSLLSLGFAALIFLTDPNFKGTISGFQVCEPFRYFLFGITASVAFFAYFVILPYFWKGQTLGLKSFKLSIFNVIFSHFFTNLIKREIFVWIMTVLVNLILSITLYIVGSINGYEAANAIITQMYTYDAGGPYFVYAVIFTSLYVITIFILVFVFFSVAFNSKRQTIIDKISKTVTIKMIDVNGSDKKNDNKNNKLRKASTRNFNLPGIIVDNPNEEISGEE